MTRSIRSVTTTILTMLATVALTTAPIGAAPIGAAPTGAASIGAASMGAAPPGPSGAWSGPGELDDPDGRTVGRWTVHGAGDGIYTVTWTGPDALPVTDARPVIESAGEVVAVPELGADGRSVSITVSAATPPETDDLDVVLSDRVLDAPLQSTPAARQSVAPLPATTTLTPDPGVPGTHPVTSSDYHLPDVKLAGMPAKIEMLGHIVRPTDATAGAPVVLFLHGRHSACYRTRNATGSGHADWPCPRGTSPVPSHLGYDYVQHLLATQGYVTVSISANGINAQDWRLPDGGAAARAALIRRHLAAWTDPANAAAIGPAGDADLDNVVLVGHSRGGEGANRASATIPLSARYRLSGQVLIGPTDFGRQTAAFIPTVTMLPYCDGDVSDLQGQAFTDVARDLRRDDTALHSSILVMGADHNFFNTEWTPGLSQAPSFDDWGGDPDGTCGVHTESRLTKGEQRAVGRSYVAGAVRLMTRGDDAMLPLFDGSRVSLASANDTDVRSHTVGLGRAVRSPGHGAVLAPNPTADAKICVGRADAPSNSNRCGAGTSSARTPHWPGAYPPGRPTQPALEMSWTAVGQHAGLGFNRPLDLTGSRLHLRTIADPAHPQAMLAIRVYDAEGQTSTVPVRSLPGLPRGDFVLGKRWAQDLSVPASAFQPRVDLAHITTVDLVSRNVRGRVWVLDVAAGHAGLTVVPDERAPMLSMEDAKVREGDSPKRRYARVPFHITGTVATPTTFVVVSEDFFTFDRRAPVRVRVPAGTRSGVVRVPFEANRRDNPYPRTLQLSAFGVSGAMPTDYRSTLRIIDDDPTPTVILRADGGTIREGSAARWSVTLSRPVDYEALAFATIRPGPLRTDGLRVADVPQTWLREQLDRPRPPPGRRLDQLPLLMVRSLRAGDRQLTFAVPTRVDRLTEGREHVTLRVSFEGIGKAKTNTVGVIDREDLLRAP